MKKVICYGAGSTGETLFDKISEKYEILAYADNDKNKHTKKIHGLPVIGFEDLKDYDYDLIIITSLPGLKPITDMLIENGTDEGRIITSYVTLTVESRIRFLEDLAKIHKASGTSASVAEAGVFQGEFAKEINRCYPDSTLYLFDTFEGFSENDLKAEAKFSDSVKGELSITSVELVMNKMTFPAGVKIFKGYFPETAQGINDSFCFVNLDMDLYLPTLEGLKFFAPKMVKGGVILIHDYFSGRYAGVENAVKEFMEASGENLRLMPIGDGISIAVVGF